MEKEQQEKVNYQKKPFYSKGFFLFCCSFFLLFFLLFLKGDQLIWYFVSVKSKKILGSTLECKKVNWCKFGAICAQDCLSKDQNSKINRLVLELPLGLIKVHKFELLGISNQLKKKKIRFPKLPQVVRSIEIQDFEAFGHYQLEKIELKRVEYQKKQKKKQKNQWKVKVLSKEKKLKVFGEVGEEIFLDFYLQNFPIYLDIPTENKSKKNKTVIFISGEIIELANFAEVDLSNLSIQKVIQEDKTLNLPEIFISKAQILFDTEQRKLKEINNVEIFVERKFKISSVKKEKNKLSFFEFPAEKLLKILKEFSSQENSFFKNIVSLEKGSFSGSLEYNFQKPKETLFKLEGQKLSALFLANKQKFRVKEFSCNHVFKGLNHESSVFKVNYFALKELNPLFKKNKLDFQSGFLSGEFEIAGKNEPRFSGKVHNLKASLKKKKLNQEELFELSSSLFDFTGDLKQASFKIPKVSLKSYSLSSGQKKQNYLFESKQIFLEAKDFKEKKTKYLLSFKPISLELKKDFPKKLQFKDGQVFWDGNFLKIKKLITKVPQNSERASLEALVKFSAAKEPKILSLKLESKLAAETGLALAKLFNLEKKVSFLSDNFISNLTGWLQLKCNLNSKKQKIEIQTYNLAAFLKKQKIRLADFESRLIFERVFEREQKRDFSFKALVFNLKAKTEKKENKLKEVSIKHLLLEKGAYSGNKLNLQAERINYGKNSHLAIAGELELPKKKRSNSKEFLIDALASFSGKIEGSLQPSDFIEQKIWQKINHPDLAFESFPIKLQLSKKNQQSTSFVFSSQFKELNGLFSSIKSTGEFNLKNPYFQLDLLESNFRGLNFTANAKGTLEDFSFKIYTDPLIQVDQVLLSSSLKFKEQKIEGFLQGWAEAKRVNFYQPSSLFNQLKVSLKTDEFSNLRIGSLELGSFEFYLESDSGSGVATVFVEEGQVKNLFFQNLNGSFNMKDNNLILNGISLETANGSVKLKGKLNLVNQKGSLDGEGKNLEIGQIARGLAEISGLNGNGNFSFHVDGHLYSLISKQKEVLSSGKFELKEGNVSQVVSIQKKLNLANLVFGGPFALNVNSLLEVLMPQNNGYYQELFGKWNLKEHKIYLSESGYRGVNQLNLNFGGYWDRQSKQANFLVLGSIPRTPIRVKKGGQISKLTNIISKVHLNNILGKIPLLESLFRINDRYFSFRIKGTTDKSSSLNESAAESFGWEEKSFNLEKTFPSQEAKL